MRRILLVDDAETLRLLERMCLLGTPWIVVTAAHGGEAAERAPGERLTPRPIDPLELSRKLRGRLGH